MHMLLARSAIVRGMQLVAGMLTTTATNKRTTRPECEAASGFQLVSWTANARSRREDELARLRQMQAGS